MTSDYKRRRPADLLRPSLLAVAALLAAMPAIALESDREKPLEVLANDSDADMTSGLVKLLGNVRINQGTLKIQAETGDVHQSRKNGEIERIVLRGSPARMEQALDNAAGQMRASAAQIDYNASTETVVLTGSVRIDEPRGTLSGEKVTYNIARGSVRAESGSSDQVRMVFPGRAPSGNTSDDKNGDD